MEYARLDRRDLDSVRYRLQWVLRFVKSMTVLPGSMLHLSRLTPRTAVARYAIAVITVVSAFLLRYFLVNGLGLGIPTFTTLYPAIMIVAVLAGLGPALLAGALAVFGADYLFLQPVGLLSVTNPADTIALAFFSVMVVLMSLLAEAYRQSQQLLIANQTETALRRSEEEFRRASEYRQLALAAAELGAWENRLTGGALSLDACCRRIFDLDESLPVTYDDLMQRIHPDDRGLLDNAVQQAIANADSGLWQQEYRVVHLDGSIRRISAHGRVFATGTGAERHAERFMGVCMDVTNIRQVEEELHRKTILYQNLFDSMDEGFCIIQILLDPSGKPADFIHIEVNAAFERQTGLHNAAGKSIHELVPTLEERWFEFYGKIALTGKPGHVVSEVTSLGRWYDIRAYRVGAPESLQVAVVFNDITKQRRSEQHIEQLNRVYTVLSDVNQTIVRERDAQAMLEAVCRIAVDKGGFRMAWVGMSNPVARKLEPIASSGVIDGYLEGSLVDLQDSTRPNRLPARAFFSGQDAICNDIDQDEQYLPWRDAAMLRGYRSAGCFPLKVDHEVIGVFTLYSGEPGFFVGTELSLLDEMAMDISYALEVYRREQRRKKIEDELLWKTAFFEAQVDSALDGILVVDSMGRKLLQNQRLKDLLDIPADISGNPEDAQQFQFVLQRVKDPDRFARRVDYLNSNPEQIDRDEIELQNGKFLERYSYPVRDKALNHYGRIWTFRDITERRQLEEQFRQAQKMEAVGQLTGGIAHDFNNLLTVILGCAEMLCEDDKGTPRQKEMAQMIFGAAKRGAELTHRMLAFARRQTLHPVAVNIKELLASLTILLRRTLRADIDLAVVQHEEDVRALADAAQLESALLNLCLNARDAMPHGGKLMIEVTVTALDADYAAQNPEVIPGQYVLITVSDTGCGIRPEILSRVFDPFFTTKDVGSGTGLGLSMVYGFTKQSQGHVKIYSEPGHGTSVKLYVPRILQRGEQLELPQAKFDSLYGSEVILLVEDDDSVREFARSQLAQFGYRVLEASNGVDALTIIQEREDIDLLLTDMIMPGGLNGRELALQACRQNQSLKVLYCSGYAESAIFHQGLLGKETKLLNKPYTRHELATRVRQALLED